MKTVTPRSFKLRRILSRKEYELQQLVKDFTKTWNYKLTSECIINPLGKNDPNKTNNKTQRIGKSPCSCIGKTHQYFFQQEDDTLPM